MERRSRYHQRREKYRQTRVFNQNSSGVLTMARRHSQRRTDAAIIILLVVTLFACIGVFSGVRRVVARWQRARGDGDSVPGPPPC